MGEYDALRAITICAAEHIGIADRVGSLEVGKDADVVITDGSPFEISGQIHHVLIDGNEYFLTLLNLLLFTSLPLFFYSTAAASICCGSTHSI